MSRRSHPHPQIEAALKHAEDNGWRVDVGGGHCWGRIYCPYNDYKNADVGFFVFLAFGALPKIQKIMGDRLDEW